MPSCLRRPMLAVAALMAATMLWVPSAAFAHATLEGSSPPRGATVKQEPNAVVFRFSEPIEGNFGAVRVYDAEGERVDEGDAFHPNGEGTRLGVHLQPGLPEGSYTATYRVVSADGHIVSGGYVFSVGKAGRAPAETVAELVAAGSSGTATGIGMGIARGVQYAALAVALGALAFLLFAWWPARRLLSESGERWERASLAYERRLRVVLLAAAVAGAISTAAAVVFEAAQAAGLSATSALDATILREELGTRFGTVWGITVLAWVLLGLGVVPALRRAAPWRIAPLFAPLTFIALEPALSGHPSTQSPVALLFPANVLHVVAISVWVGGLASLVLILPAATRALEAPDRSRMLAATLARFSPVALLCVALILLTGLGQAYAYVRDLDNLLDTAYGRAVLIKFVLLVGLLIPLGAYNRYRSVPRLERIAGGGEAPGRAGLLLRRALRGEVALIVVVLGVTAALAGYAPATAVQSGPFSGSASLGPAELEVTVDPARVGSNQIHLYLFDAKSGAQFSPIKELDATATLPDKSIGPLPLEPQRSGPGHYTVQGAQLGVAGDWQLEVSVRVSAFDEYTAEVQVPNRMNVKRKEAMKLKTTLALIAVLALAAPAGAGAHVTLQPQEAAAGDFTVLNVRVPNERDDAATTKVDVQFPPGFVFASYQPVSGWSVEVKMEKLAKPLTSHGEKITEQVSQMTWTAASGKAGIQPGQFQDFPISVQIPGEAGDALTFKALQTYDDGEVVRWIGAPESEQPAPQVAVTEGSGDHHGAAADSESSESDDSDGASKGLGIAALILAALGLLAAGAALLRSRQTA